MNILIVFETYSGGTLAAVEFVSKVLSEKHHTVTAKRASETNPSEFQNFEFIILASPSWLENDKDGQPHQNFLKMIENSKDVTFTNKKFAVFGLGDESYAHFCGAVDVLKKFITDRGGEVTIEPLRIDNYYMNIPKYEVAMNDWVTKLPLQ